MKELSNGTRKAIYTRKLINMLKSLRNVPRALHEESHEKGDAAPRCMTFFVSEEGLSSSGKRRKHGFARITRFSRAPWRKGVLP